MSWIRAKQIKGRTYYYEVENRREGGKTKQRVLRYLGKQRPESEARPDIRASSTTLPPKLGTAPLTGTWVKLWGEVVGVIITGTTQVEACPWPRRGRGSVELLRCPYQPPGTVTVQWQQAGQVQISQVPLSEIEVLGRS